MLSVKGAVIHFYIVSVYSSVWWSFRRSVRPSVRPLSWKIRGKIGNFEQMQMSALSAVMQLNDHANNAWGRIVGLLGPVSLRLNRANSTHSLRPSPSYSWLSKSIHQFVSAILFLRERGIERKSSNWVFLSFCVLSVWASIWRAGGSRSLRHTSAHCINTDIIVRLWPI